MEGLNEKSRRSKSAAIAALSAAQGGGVAGRGVTPALGYGRDFLAEALIVPRAFRPVPR